jgi:hypothetical protein
MYSIKTQSFLPLEPLQELVGTSILVDLGEVGFSFYLSSEDIKMSFKKRLQSICVFLFMAFALNFLS